tara:strand:+ start:705 stop:839 length:135 start_codon:yes stop_codon:yes gene_type:complete
MAFSYFPVTIYRIGSEIINDKIEFEVSSNRMISHADPMFARNSH